MSGQARSAEVRPLRRRQHLPALLGLALGVALLHVALIDTVVGSAPAMRDEPHDKPPTRWVAVRLAAAGPAPTPAPAPAARPTTRPTPPPAPARVDPATRVPALREVSDRKSGPGLPQAPRPQESHRSLAGAMPRAEAPGPSVSAARAVAEPPAAPVVEPAASTDVMGTTPADATTHHPAGEGDLPLRLAAAPASAAPEADRPDTPPAAMPSVPTYPTSLPPAFRHGYDMRRGVLSGQGELSLQRTAAGYEARLEGRIAGFSILSWHSRGHVDAAGFAPDRFVDERRGRAPQAANFRRDAGSGEAPRITYSGPTTVQPLPAGTQDRLSWMLQLAAIAQARPPRPGDTIEMYVSGARGDADVWTFRVASIDAVVTPAGRTEALHLIRAPRGEHETRAEVWLDPARHHLPVRARLSNRADGSDALELELRDIGPP